MKQWTYNDGGRKIAGYAPQKKGRDCVIRSIAIVGDLDYGEVYDEIHHRSREGTGVGTKKRLELIASLAMQGDTPDNGVYAEIYKGYLADYGWEWTPTVFIGSGCQVHLKAGELPTGRLLVRASKHLTAVLYGVIHDTHDPSRSGTRCVYGYWEPPKGAVFDQ